MYIKFRPRDRGKKKDNWQRDAWTWSIITRWERRIDIDERARELFQFEKHSSPSWKIIPYNVHSCVSNSLKLDALHQNNIKTNSTIHELHIGTLKRSFKRRIISIHTCNNFARQSCHFFPSWNYPTFPRFPDDIFQLSRNRKNKALVLGISNFFWIRGPLHRTISRNFYKSPNI